MMEVAKIAVLSEMKTKHIYTVWAECTIVYVKPVGASRNQ
jgi:hypothetical protein